MTSLKMLGLMGSPRRGGNSDLLLDEALKGASEAGAEILKINVCDLNISGCIECNDCYVTGECSIDDDMDLVYEAIEKADRIVIAAPMFYMGIPAQTKAVIDRGQRYWAIKNELQADFPRPAGLPRRYGAFIGVGGTKGKKLFDGTIQMLKYYFSDIDVTPVEDRYILVRSVENEGDIREHEDVMQQAYELGRYLMGLDQERSV